MSRPTIALALAFTFLVPFYAPATAQDAIPANIVAAVNDPGRPAQDKELDAVRDPAAMLAFSSMKPGDVVADFLPGRGYYTRMISKTVGATGKVYAIVPAENLARRAMAADAVNAIAADPVYFNVSVASPSMDAFTTPEPVDIVWFTNNYHDVRNGRGSEAMVDLNKAIFDALKPGGVYFIVDHRAADGTPLEQQRALHRIVPDELKDEVTQAGFVLNGESDALTRPSDDLTTHSSFASSEFVFRFRKPQ